MARAGADNSNADSLKFSLHSFAVCACYLGQSPPTMSRGQQCTPNMGPLSKVARRHARAERLGLILYTCVGLCALQRVWRRNAEQSGCRIPPASAANVGTIMLSILVRCFHAASRWGCYYAAVCQKAL
eukprot:6460816-Amphidinium_carterae.3